MNKKAQKITVIIVFVLVVLFGVGQFFSFSNPSATSVNGNASGTQNAPSGPQPTEVVQYVPTMPSDHVPVEKGSCWTNSIAAPYRADAWRCMVGNGVQDPCFEISGSTSTLLCGMDPANPAATSTFLLSLTKPLPPALGIPPAPENWAWLVELQNGEVCSPFTGTMPFAAGGETAEYGCAPQYKGDSRMIFGGLNASTSVWTAEVGTLSASTSTFPPPMVSSSVVPVATVWQ
jgi:hypothetical protein